MPHPGFAAEAGEVRNWIPKRKKDNKKDFKIFYYYKALLYYYNFHSQLDFEKDQKFFFRAFGTQVEFVSIIH